MKTLIIYFSLFHLSLQFSLNAQVSPYQLDDIIPELIVQKNECKGLRPVYFNYSKRQLYSSDKTPLNGRHFLESCRGINDSHIRYQIRKYDQLTFNKRKILGAMIACGVGGYVGLMSSVIMTSTSGPVNPNAYTIMGISAASLFIATPILAISSGIPHQKKKRFYSAIYRKLTIFMSSLKLIHNINF